jgi:peptidoglycan-associated lipoprotein
MLSLMRIGRSAKFVVLIASALSLGACASQQSQTGLEGTAATPGSQQDFVVNVGDRVFFANDSTDLSPEARGVLDRQAKWLQSYPRYTVTVEGHADERGTREYNFALGQRRSVAARDYLISRGVQSTRLKTISYGKERPVAVCEEESCFSQNRRAVTVLNNGG